MATKKRKSDTNDRIPPTSSHSDIHTRCDIAPEALVRSKGTPRSTKRETDTGPLVDVPRHVVREDTINETR